MNDYEQLAEWCENETLQEDASAFPKKERNHIISIEYILAEPDLPLLQTLYTPLQLLFLLLLPLLLLPLLLPRTQPPLRIADRVVGYVSAIELFFAFFHELGD